MSLRGVMLDRLPLDRGDLDFADLAAALDGLDYHDATPRDAVARRIAGAGAVFTNKVVLDRDVIRAAAGRGLRLICLMATGTDNVDVAAAREAGVAVTHCRGYATPAVTQHVFALITALATRLPDYAAAVRRGDWGEAGTFCLLDYPIRELAGGTLGIVGHGELGRAVARVAEALGMIVLVSRRPGGDDRPGRASFHEVLARADVLSLHCPLTPETRGLIGADALAAMKETAFLVNTARGALVDEVALAEALRRGAIAGAGLDVLSAEPPPSDHALLAGDIPNLIVTPHTAWGTRAARQRLVDQLAENVAAFRAGESLRRVD